MALAICDLEGRVKGMIHILDLFRLYPVLPQDPWYQLLNSCYLGFFVQLGVFHEVSLLGVAGVEGFRLNWGKPKTAGFGTGKSIDLSEVLHVSTKVRLVSGFQRR
ncbi:MAG: hypothetical protein RLZZ218_429 [Actinomycetota bacterium]